MRKLLLLLGVALSLTAFSQKKNKEVSIAVTNNHTAYPFASFSKLFTGPYHPGFELGYGFDWRTRKKHDWTQAFHIGYFYHRFVQHGIPIYTQFGYRYRLWERINFNADIGAGYMHSIPATAVLKANDNGDYSKSKGIGRGQAIANFCIGARYKLDKTTNPPAVFIQYTQQLQTPFINSYVPLLPYNTIAVGFVMPFKK